MDGYREGDFFLSSLDSGSLPVICLYDQLALCISIIHASGPPDWKNVKLPAGRTKKACLHVYNSLKKQSEGIALAGPDTAAVPKPRKKAEKSVSNNGKKRGRPAKAKMSAETVLQGEDDDDEGSEAKKVKLKKEGSEDEIGIETVEGDGEET
jgi:hypothetical protein